MKKIIYLSILSLFIFTSCNNDEVKRLKEENSKLYDEIENRDKTVNDMFKSMNDIEQNLYEIRAKEMVIKQASNSTEVNQDSSDVRDRITKEIQSINELLEINKQTISKLRKQMKTANIKITELEKTIAKLTKQMEEKDQEIAELKDKLEKLNFTVEELNTKVETLTQEKDAQTEVIEKQTEEINAAWYAFGTKNELFNKNIITRQGGVVGIGKSSKLSSDMNTDYFTKIDIRKTTEITLMAKEVNILSTHPAGSYEFKMRDKTYDKLIIKDPKKFWSITKYLVVETK